MSTYLYEALIVCFYQVIYILRVNLHSIIASMSRDSLLKTGISEIWGLHWASSLLRTHSHLTFRQLQSVESHQLYMWYDKNTESMRHIQTRTHNIAQYLASLIKWLSVCLRVKGWIVGLWFQVLLHSLAYFCVIWFKLCKSINAERFHALNKYISWSCRQILHTLFAKCSKNLDTFHGHVGKFYINFLQNVLKIWLN